VQELLSRSFVFKIVDAGGAEVVEAGGTEVFE
jgi:hypothetical protein